MKLKKKGGKAKREYGPWMSTTSIELLLMNNEGQKRSGLLTMANDEEINGGKGPRDSVTYDRRQGDKARGNQEGTKGYKWKGKEVICVSGENGTDSGEDQHWSDHNSLRKSSKIAIISNNDIEDLAINMEKTYMIQKHIDDNGLLVGGNELVEIPITNESQEVTNSKSQPMWKRISKAEQKKV